MASNDQDVKEGSQRRFARIVNTWIGHLGSFTLSLVGGLILTWWELNYHPTNVRQWMVPLGLILFVTPLIVWFSVLISDFCNPTNSSTENSHKKPFHDDPESGI